MKRTLQTVQRLVNDRVGAVLRCSHRYESEPWGFEAAQKFSNQALEVSTDLTAHEVLDAVQDAVDAAIAEEDAWLASQE